jgi:ATP-dependent Clp protease adaptor protein ClpS
VIEMLCKIFCLSVDAAYQNAVEVDKTGRTIVITCELPQAEFGRDQIHAYGADPRMARSSGSMKAMIEPAN